MNATSVKPGMEGGGQVVTAVTPLEIATQPPQESQNLTDCCISGTGYQL